jgi:hypothetical protein
MSTRRNRTGLEAWKSLSLLISTSLILLIIEWWTNVIVPTSVQHLGTIIDGVMKLHVGLWRAPVILLL